jgi:hypothetical protein
VTFLDSAAVKWTYAWLVGSTWREERLTLLSRVRDLIKGRWEPDRYRPDSLQIAKATRCKDVHYFSRGTIAENAQVVVNVTFFRIHNVILNDTNFYVSLYKVIRPMHKQGKREAKRRYSFRVDSLSPLLTESWCQIYLRRRGNIKPVSGKLALLFRITYYNPNSHRFTKLWMSQCKIICTWNEPEVHTLQWIAMPLNFWYTFQTLVSPKSSYH